MQHKITAKIPRKNRTPVFQKNNNKKTPGKAQIELLARLGSGDDASRENGSETKSYKSGHAADMTDGPGAISKVMSFFEVGFAPGRFKQQQDQLNHLLSSKGSTLCARHSLIFGAVKRLPNKISSLPLHKARPCTIMRAAIDMLTEWPERELRPHDALQVLKEASQEIPEINAFLGALYETGSGSVSADPQSAFEHYTLAAEQKVAEICAYLGGCLITGEQFDRIDVGLALKYLDVAGKEFPVCEAKLLYPLYLTGVRDESDREIVKKDVKKAMRLFETALPEAKADEIYRAGEIYEKGEGNLEPDIRMALKCYKAAAEKKSVPALMRCADLMLPEGAKRFNLQPDPKKAEKMLKLAAQLNDKDACLRLGKLYLEGAVLQQNTRMAQQYLHRAADRGDIEAVRLVGQIYEETGETKAAVRRYRKAAEAGCVKSALRLLEIYTSGQCEEGSKDESMRLVELLLAHPDALEDVDGETVALYAAIVHEKAGDSVGALDFYLKALPKHPERAAYPAAKMLYDGEVTRKKQGRSPETFHHRPAGSAAQNRKRVPSRSHVRNG